MLLPMETNMVEKWLKVDPARWVAGAVAGVFAGLIMMGFAMLVAKMSGLDVTLPLKMPSLPILGSYATDYDSGIKSIVIGLIVHTGLCAVLGAIFAHFTYTNSVGSLFGMGLTWGLFSWIFICNLFAPSFKEVLWVGVNHTLPALFVHIVFGVSLISLRFIDPIFRGMSR